MSEVSALASGRNGELLSREVVKVKKSYIFNDISKSFAFYKDKLFFSHNEHNEQNPCN